VLKIRPPLVLNGEQVDMVVQGLDECFAETTNVGASG
jgi:4-aminobutyrate aminotransferase-like enzyme